jgi:hypothetical protein
MGNRVLAFFLTVAMLVVLAASPSTGQMQLNSLSTAIHSFSEGVFADDEGSIFEADIEWLAAAGITMGCNPPENDRYCPGDAVTRGQMAAFLVRALGYVDDGGGDRFTDDDGSIFEADIDRLAAAGVTRGCNPPANTRFCPDRSVTRGEMAAFFHRALVLPELPTDPLDVGAFGVVTEVGSASFKLVQQSFEFEPNEVTVVVVESDELAIGSDGDLLEVQLSENARILIGNQPAAFDQVVTGLQVAALGRMEDGRLVAEVVASLSDVGQPAPSAATPVAAREETSLPSGASELLKSLCLGQDMAYDDEPAVREFQGCWGGPSAKDEFRLGISTSLGLSPIDWIINSVGYNAALGGWGFDFPHEFKATAPSLVYHVPGSIDLEIEPLPATGVESTFWGGIGVDVFIDVDMCLQVPVVGGLLGLRKCWNIGRPTLGIVPSQLYESTEPAPRNARLDIEELTCPGVGIEIPETPISLVAVEACTDLSLSGVPFTSTVQTNDRNNSVASLAFSDGPRQMTIIPDARALLATFSKFDYRPDLIVGFYMRLAFLNGLKVLRLTPDAPLFSGPFPAITTPFPLQGSLMTLATDPNSPIDNLRYLEQPRRAEFTFPVAPARTVLAFTVPDDFRSRDFQVILTEEYDGSPIAGAELALSARGGSMGVTTDDMGMAKSYLPRTQYVDVAFGGSEFYLPTEAHFESATLIEKPSLRRTTSQSWPAETGHLDQTCRFMVTVSNTEQRSIHDNTITLVTGGQTILDVEVERTVSTETFTTEWVTAGPTVTLNLWLSNQKRVSSAGFKTEIQCVW